jgi:hypothetical protein
LFIALLEDAQQQYLTFPHQRTERPVRQVSLNLTFKRLAPVDDVAIEAPQDAEEGVDDILQQPPRLQDVSVTLQFSIRPVDTAQSIERCILVKYLLSICRFQLFRFTD